MSDLTSKLGSNSIAKVNPISVFWLMAPMMLLFITNTIILLSIEPQSMRELYYASQIEWFKSLNHGLNQLPNYVWSNVTQLGEAMVLLPLVFLCTLSNRKAWQAIIYTTPAAGLLSVTLKRLTSMPRPAAIIDHSEMTIIGKTLIGQTSLPSGHTITVFAASIAVLMSLYPSMKKKQDKLVLSVMLMLTVLISLSRVAVGAHWPLDLLVGAACGWTAGYSGVYLYNKSSRLVLESNVWNHAFICIFSIFSILLSIRALNLSSNHLIIWVSLACAIVVVVNLINEQRLIRKQAEKIY